MQITVKENCLSFLTSNDVSVFYEYLLKGLDVKLKLRSKIFIFSADVVSDSNNPQMLTVTINFIIDNNKHKYCCYRAINWCCSNIQIK